MSTTEDEAVGINSIVALPGGAAHSGLELGRQWHFLSLFFWIANGLIYVTLLFLSGQWRRLVPTSLDIIPGAVNTFLDYATFKVPQAAPGAIYDPLQQLAYFTVVYIFAPLTILTGAAISPAVAERAPWLPGMFGRRQSARSIHFMLMSLYLLFLIAHVSMIAITDLTGNMNHIVFGTSSHAITGVFAGAAAIGVIVLIHVAATKWSLSSPDTVLNYLTNLLKPWREFIVGKRAAQANSSMIIEDSVAASDEAIRQFVTKLLVEDKIETTMSPYPENDSQFQAICKQLRLVESDDTQQKLIISGYAAHPVQEQKCFECMYYLVHRRWCNLPEINLPAEPDWWCRLWRI